MMRKPPTVAKVPLLKKTQQAPNKTSKPSQLKSATKTVPKPNAGIVKSGCFLPPKPSEDVNRYDEIAAPLHDDHQTNGENFEKADDHLVSSTPSSFPTQEHEEISKKLLEDLEVERLVRKQLELNSHRLRSQLQELRLKVDGRPSAALNHSVPATPSTQPEQKHNFFVNNHHRMKNSVVISKIQSPVDVGYSGASVKENDETVEKSLPVKLDGGKSKIADLDSSNPLIEMRFAAMESEMADLKSALNHAIDRVEALEKENAELKSELDNEMELHSTEIAKLSDQSHASFKKLEELENSNAELVRKLADSKKARCEEVESWAKRTQEAITERNEAKNAQTEQHEKVTQYLKDLERKDNFIATLQGENEYLCQQNQGLELRIDFLEEKVKTDMHQYQEILSGDKHAGCRKQFERLHGEVENTKEAFEELWAIHDQETEALKRANKEKESEQTKLFQEEVEKLKITIDKKTQLIDLLQKEKGLIKQIEYKRYKDEQRCSNYPQNTGSEDYNEF